MIRIFVGILILFTVSPLYSQLWDGPYRHGSVLCYRLSEENQPVILAAKTCGTFFIMTVDAVVFKIKSPYKLRGGLARVKITTFNREGDVINTGQESLRYKNGWIYHKVGISYDGFPLNDFIITIYEKNDFGQSNGRKKSIRTHLFDLDTSEMPMNYNM